MHDYIEERALEEAKYIITYKTTVRDVAKMFGVSKTTVHKDLTQRLPKINPQIASRVRLIIDINKDERSARGGRALSLITKMRREALQ